MRVLHLAAAAVVIAGCGGGGGGGGGTQPPVPVSSVAITPSGAQSITVGQTVNFAAQPRDAQNNSLTRPVSWTTSDQSKVSLSATTGSNVTATGVAAGSSQITATSEGKSASVTVTVAAGGGFPSTAAVTATTSDTFSPTTVHIAAGGTVTWSFEKQHNVTFGANKPTGGDIPDQTSGNASRTFPTAGNFGYTCTLHAGMNGTVVVH